MAADKYGDTPLHFAAGFGHAEATTALLDAGADPHIINHEGDRPIDMARQENMRKAYKVLKAAE